MGREPSRCALWQRTPLTDALVDDFFLNGCDLVETYADDGHFSRRLIRCRECGQAYLKEFNEIVDWVGGNDAQYITLIPVETPEDVEAARTAGVLRAMDFLPQLRIDWPSDAKERTIYWQGRQ
jgi:hypothetical protein